MEESTMSVCIPVKERDDDDIVLHIHLEREKRKRAYAFMRCHILFYKQPMFMVHIRQQTPLLSLSSVQL